MTNEEKERVAILVDNKILTVVEPEEVEMLVSPPNARRRQLPNIGKEKTDDTIF